MKIAVRLGLVLAIAIMTCNQSRAGEPLVSGNDLIEGMRVCDVWNSGGDLDAADTGEAMQYLGYITGVYDATSHLYNIPKGIRPKQLIAVVSEYLRSHAERWNEPGARLVSDALLETFPLKKQK